MLHLRALIAPPIAATLLGLAALPACNGSAARPAHCPASVTSAVVNGDDVPSTPISPGRLATIGALRKPDGELVCTGTYLGDRWILTARHCIVPETFDGLVFHTSRDLIVLQAPVAEHYPHPELDVMLLRVPASAALSALDLEPIDLWESSMPGDWLGKTVTLAGFGDRADGSDGKLQFLDEPVVSVDANLIVVDGGSEHGACLGDSGGPLLATSVAGAPRLIGVLSGGAASCRGRDRYVAATAFADWVSQTRVGAAQDPCAGLTPEGTCDNGVARWCAGEFVDAESCATGHRLCGWDVGAAGYRCVPGDSDPCRGAGRRGDCAGNVLRVCQQGALAEIDCGECGGLCQRGADGHAGCL